MLGCHRSYPQVLEQHATPILADTVRVSPDYVGARGDDGNYVGPFRDGSHHLQRGCGPQSEGWSGESAWSAFPLRVTFSVAGDPSFPRACPI